MLDRTPPWLWLLVAASAASVGMLWPFSAQLGHVTLDTGDAIHQAWTIHWIEHALTTPGADVFAAPSNYPFTMASVINQPIYTSALLGLPFYLVGWSPIAVFNAAVLFSFALSCWAMALLGRQLTGSGLAGLAAGILYAFSDVRLSHIVHLNLLSGFWAILLLYLLLRLWKTPRTSRLGLAAHITAIGVLAAAQALADAYNGIYLVAALLVLALYQFMTRRSGLALRHTLLLGASALLALLLCLPVMLPTMRVWRDLNLARDLSDHERYSARLENYLVTARPSQLGYNLGRFYHTSPTSGGAEHTLWPGLLTLSLAVVGLLTARRRDRQEQGYFVLLALAALYLSLGPTIYSGENDRGISSVGYRWLYEHVPLFSAARVPSRWALLVQLALSALAAYGFAALLRLGARAIRRSVRVALATLPLATFALVVADSWHGPVRGTTALVGQPVPEVYRALARLPPGPLLEWPLENADELLSRRYEYYSMYHQRRIVNSASSIVPPRYSALHDFLRRFPAAETVIFLRDLGVRYVNINCWEISGGPAFAARLQAVPGLRLIGTYEGGRHYLYEVLQEQPGLAASSAEILTGPGGPHLSLDVVAPLWRGAPADYYGPNRPGELRLVHSSGREEQLILSLPPMLLPGTYVWPLPADVSDGTAVRLADQMLPLAPPPTQLVERLVEGPQLVAQPPPARAIAGRTLPCRAYGKGPLTQPGLVLSVNLVNAGWEFFGKQDHYFDEGLPPPNEWNAQSFTLMPCDLTLEGDLPPGDYFLAIGLYDPATGAPIPLAGADGILVPSLWRIPSPIHIEAQ